MSQQKVTVEVEVKPTGDLSQQKAQVEQLAKSLNAAKDAAKAIAVPDKPQEKRREDAATDKKPQRAETVVADTEPQEPQRAETVVADAEPQEPQRAETVVADTGPQEPQRAETVVADPVSQFESMRDRLNRSVAASGMDQEELQLFDLANLGATQEQLQEIAGLWKTLKDSKVELKVQGFEEAARHKIKTAAMTDDEVRLFDLENLGATEEQLQAVKNLQSQIKTADVEVKVNQIEKKVDRAAETSGMTPDEIQLFDMQQLGATEEQLQRIRELQKEIQAANVESRVQSFEQGVKREVETSGMKPEEVQLFDLKSAGATEEQLQRIRDLQGQRTESGLAESIREVEEALRKQIATMGMSAEESQLWSLKQKGATDKQLETVERLQAKQKSAGAAGVGGMAKAMAGFGGLAIMSQSGGVGGVAGQAIGGAMSGASIGSAIPGIGTVGGAAIGGAVAAAGGIFDSIKDGLGSLIGPTERFKQAMAGMASSIMSSERTIASVRMTGMATMSDFSRIRGDILGDIMAARMEDRPAAIRRARESLEREGTPDRVTDSGWAMSSLVFSRALRGEMTTGETVREWRTRDTELGRERESMLATLRAAERHGVAGITREPDRASPTIGDASSVYDSIAMMIGERSPMERATERTAEATESLRAIAERILGEVSVRLPAPLP